MRMWFYRIDTHPNLIKLCYLLVLSICMVLFRVYFFWLGPMQNDLIWPALFVFWPALFVLYSEQFYFLFPLLLVKALIFSLQEFVDSSTKQDKFGLSCTKSGSVKCKHIKTMLVKIIFKSTSRLEATEPESNIKCTRWTRNKTAQNIKQTVLARKHKCWPG